MGYFKYVITAYLSINIKGGNVKLVLIEGYKVILSQD